MMAELSGYELSRNWFDFSFEEPDLIRPVHTALYFFIIEHCNRLGWKKKFGLPMEMAKDAIGVKNYRTYTKAFNDLVEWGFIEVYERSKNQYSANVIGIVKNTKATTKALSKAIQKHGQKQVHGIVGIDKPLTKEPNNLKPNNIDDKKSSAYSLCIDFWLKEFHPGWSFGAVHGVKMKSIIKKIKDLLKVSGRESTDKAIHESFKAVCNNLPKYYLIKDLAMIDSKFNEIIQEIKNGKQGKNDPYKDIIEGVIREHYP